MRLGDIVALTGNIAAALRRVEEELDHVESGHETPALDAAVAELRGLSAALIGVRAVELVRLRLAALPPAERQPCEVQILHSLARAVKGFADLVEALHGLSREAAVPRDLVEALHDALSSEAAVPLRADFP